MKIIVFILSLFSAISIKAASETEKAEATDYPTHFISFDFFLGNARTIGLYYGHTVYNLNSDTDGTHLLTACIGTGIFGITDDPEVYATPPPIMPPISSFLRYIVGGDVFCFELEAGAYISSALRRDAPDEYQDGELWGPKYNIVDFPVGIALSVIPEPVYLRWGFGAYIRGRGEGGAYLSFAIGVAL